MTSPLTTYITLARPCPSLLTIHICAPHGPLAIVIVKTASAFSLG